MRPSPWFLLSACALAFVSCVQPVAVTGDGIVYPPCEPVVLAPAEGATAAERESISAAIALWRQVGLTTLTLDDVPGAARVPIVFRDGPAPFHGLYQPTTGEVVVNRILDGAGRDITVAHEVGHALGLPHVALSVRTSVMNPGNLVTPPGNDDEGELRVRWSCPLVP